MSSIASVISLAVLGPTEAEFSVNRSSLSVNILRAALKAIAEIVRIPALRHFPQVTIEALADMYTGESSSNFLPQRPHVSSVGSQPPSLTVQSAK